MSSATDADIRAVRGTSLSLADALPQALCLVGRHLEWHEHNAAFATLWQLDSLPAPGSSLVALLRPHVAAPEGLTAQLSRLVSGPLPAEDLLRHADGRLIALTAHASVGGPILLSFQPAPAFADTDTPAAGADLAQLMRLTGAGLFEFDGITESFQWSAGFLALVGYEEDDFPITPEGYEALLHPEDRGLYQRECGRFAASRGLHRLLLYRLRTSSGSWIWLEESALAERDSDGAIVSLTGAVIDVSKRVEAEQALAATGQRLRDLMESSLQAVLIHRTLKPLFANRACAELLGFNEVGELLALGTLEDMIPREPPSALPGGSSAGRRRIIRADGRIAEVRFTERDVVWDGQPVRQLVMVDESDSANLAIERDRLAASLDMMDEAVALFDGDDILLASNSAFRSLYRHLATATLTGLSYADLLRQGIAAGLYDNALIRRDREAWIRARLREHRQPPTGAYEEKLADGRVLAARDRLLPDGSRLFLRSDITSRRLAEDQLQRSVTQLHGLLGSSPVGVLIEDLGGTVLFANERMAEMFRLPHADLVSGHIQRLLAEPLDAEMLAELIAARGSYRDVELEYRLDGGESLIVLRSAVRTDYAGKAAIVSWLYDISPLKAAQADLLHLATRDPLTGLANRSHFLARGGEALALATRYGRPLSVLLLDLDGFKLVNDTWGHAAGDAILQLTAQTCLSQLRTVDLLGRLGGEEFAVLLPETGLEGAMAVAERLRLRIAEARTSIAGAAVGVTTSIGVADLQSGSVNASDGLDHLLAVADRALYAAKRGGRNRVCSPADAGIGS
ncbi:diguanylate cyclase [Radicibacter daui]|uniref:diguanylate cyclase n=1 Tax=Radicibacter daui TaxID=3064829 RepID=UPI004046D749